MPPEKFKRRLAALLCADVEGFGRLMGDDEDVTVRILIIHRDIVATLITKHANRLILNNCCRLSQC